MAATRQSKGRAGTATALLSWFAVSFGSTPATSTGLPVGTRSRLRTAVRWSYIDKVGQLLEEAWKCGRVNQQVGRSLWSVWHEETSVYHMLTVFGKGASFCGNINV